MKKLSIFAMLGCLLTVGGVYAQWVYGQASAGSVSESIIPQMAGVGESSKKGTIKLVTSGLTMVIDEDPSNQYVPVLNIQGSVSITFEANLGADQSVKDNGIKMAWTLTQTANWNYDTKLGTNPADPDLQPIFTLANCTDVPIHDGNPCDSYEIGAGVFRDKITLNLTSKLDTRAKFDNFKSYLNRENSVFTLAVYEVTENA